ncbi:hypothetical protein GF339_15520 [candidate division KSB3 bacterium]|uniref:Polyamine aminopropyltransferase n=1 Tax=candidate division KSB3 bacterium TaxID=2044937 RepID=A0A9D5Q727_9BACT|nr:hypothetical protein [candidate division KSB3 bacterium]MBD3325993.1 hypothetical protein [candidate division KSB3 bacterium]
MRKASVLLFSIHVWVFVTGTAGLIYQVTWQKYISRLLGSDTIATAIILATFLGGLSFGYYLCGKLTTRVKNHVRVYALLEGVIGLWCLLFPAIFRGVEALTRGWHFSPPLMIMLQGVFASILLIGIPTVSMGGTIPFLTRGIARNIVEATPIHATIYAINTAGAFLGTLLAGFYLIPTFGLPDTVQGTAFLNLAAAVFFLAISPTMRARGAEKIAPAKGKQKRKSVAPRPTPPRFSSAVLYSIAFLSGFYVMTLENVLIRITNLSLGSSSYSFSLIVAVFILSIAIGSYVVGRFQHLSRSLLFFNQLGITLLLLGVYLTLDAWPYWAHVIRIGFQANMVGFWQYYSYVFLALLGILVLPVSFMGATVPIVFHEAKQDLRRVGKQAGMVFSWNTLGNLAGSLGGGILLFYVLNSARVFLVAACLAACSVALAGWQLSSKHRVGAGALILLTGVFFGFKPFYDETHFMFGTFRERVPLDISLSGPQRFFDAYNQGRTLLFYDDGPTCTVAVIEDPVRPPFPQKPRAIVVNGKSDSNTIGDMYTLKLSAHLPALLAPKREKILVIGLGTGVTAGELTLYDDVERLDIAEISPVVIDALPYFAEFTSGLQDDPRVHLHAGDAFRILGRSDQRWDMIISEPSNPWVTGVDLLFTREFYQLVRDHLTEDGLLLQWAQVYSASPQMLGMMLHTIQQEFSQSRVFMASNGDLLILASNTPFSRTDLIRAEEVLRQHPAVQESLATINFPSLETILLREIWTPSYLATYFTHHATQTMDEPRLHYIAGKNFFLGENIEGEFLLNSTSVTYLDEYLLVQQHQNWRDFPFSKETFDAFIFSTADQVKRVLLPMAYAVELKAYLNNPDLFFVSPEGVEEGGLTLLPFLGHQAYEEQDWSKIGLTDASFREKAETLLEHIHRFRNWIVPYPIDGLLALLEDGMSQGQDMYERSWCALQLALLLLQEGTEKARVQHILDEAARQNGGQIVLSNQDRVLLEAVKKMMNIPEEVPVNLE